MIVVILSLAGLVSVFGAHALALRKGRSPKWWVFSCLIFGPLPLLLLAPLPAKSVNAA
jgi:multidrug transporter EmrE-like cation transporter